MLKEVLAKTRHDAARLTWAVTTQAKATRVVDTTEEVGLDVFRPGGGWQQ
jgi:hypothetical protein